MSGDSMNFYHILTNENLHKILYYSIPAGIRSIMCKRGTVEYPIYDVWLWCAVAPIPYTVYITTNWTTNANHKNKNISLTSSRAKLDGKNKIKLKTEADLITNFASKNQQIAKLDSQM